MILSFFLISIAWRARNNADVPLLQVVENLHFKNLFISFSNFLTYFPVVIFCSFRALDTASMSVLSINCFP